MKKTKTGKAQSAVISRADSYQDAITRHLSKIPQIDAVFLLTDDTNVVHVFSVVREFQSTIYNKLLKKEGVIEKKFREIAFEFHVRAHQGRKPAEAVPFEAELVYRR